MIERIKQHVAAGRIQIALLDPEGVLVDSCHTHINLRNYVGKALHEVSPIFEALMSSILELQSGGAAFGIPMLTFDLDGQQYDLNLDFRRLSEYPDYIIWTLADNRKFNYKLQQMQQERNDSVIRNETIRRQQQLLSQANERLEMMNQGLDRFAYIVSHDLKSPLRAIGNLADWIEEGIADNDPEEVQRNLDLLKRRVRRMESLIEGILHYSRAGRIQVERIPVNVRKLLEEIMESNHQESPAILALPEELPVLFTSRTSLYQVFANLISNAIKYNDQAVPELVISAVRTGEFWRFTVADNGPGIAPKHHETIFEIFGTLQSKDSYESTGIGLTIVQKIVEDAGGTIELDSALGEGARFSFTWPAG
ncbi:MAG: ATP-binding protein [Bacteroidota bacterium]